MNAFLYVRVCLDSSPSCAFCIYLRFSVRKVYNTTQHQSNWRDRERGRSDTQRVAESGSKKEREARSDKVRAKEN